MASMAIADLDREAAARRNAATDHALRCLRGPSPNSINGPSNWVIALTRTTASPINRPTSRPILQETPDD